jgi:catechol 2,3-dioxygenase-like lactoylglutathione lyase family enzyme
MLANSELIAFGATTQPERAKSFYGSTLGLRLIADEPFAIVFDANGTMLRLQKANRHTPPPFTALGWRVDDMAAMVQKLLTAGVQLERFQGFEQDTTGVWTAPDGTKVAWFKDPDGNVLSLTQFAPAPGRA